MTENKILKIRHPAAAPSLPPKTEGANGKADENGKRLLAQIAKGAHQTATGLSLIKKGVAQNDPKLVDEGMGALQAAQFTFSNAQDVADGLPPFGNCDGSSYAIMMVIMLTQSIMAVQTTTAQLGAKLAQLQSAYANSETAEMAQYIPPSDATTTEIQTDMIDTQNVQTKYSAWLQTLQSQTDSIQQLVSDLSNSLSRNFSNSQAILSLWQNVASGLISK
jgi:hypothetical protein